MDNSECCCVCVANLLFLSVSLRVSDGRATLAVSIGTV